MLASLLLTIVRSVALLLILGVPVLGEEKYAPLPKPITDAKTVYVLNQTGAPEAADRAYKELRSWGRFVIVEKQEDADLVLRLSVSDAKDAGVALVPIGQWTWGVPIRVRFVTLSVFYKPKPDDEALWAITRSTGSGGTKACVKEFRKRFPKPAKEKK